MQTELKSCQELLEQFRNLKLDQTEFACLRALVLFKSSTDTSKHLSESGKINSLRDEAQLTLSKYIGMAYPSDPLRFGNLLLLLAPLKCLSVSTIQEIFITKSLGPAPIESVICDMYRTT